ncbi:DNA polymerase III subunit delta [Parolsenella catena]|uniref:DNA polymerase III subunit delta n=1 Tax=Parolsenella catena TaxID=2003188 RepID=A0A3G9K860_9ACTN|nr:DNA polymerase III subunit delta [Parolsenella catena]BBH50159.1 DNA polymerase III subunit delta [Parolsenella catena]
MADLLPAYLIVGADELKRDAAVRRLRSHVPADMADFNLDELDGASLEEPGQLISSAQTMPFCADFRLVIVNGAGELAKPVSEAVVSYLADPNPQCVLCLVAEKLAKNTRLYKAVAKVGPHSVIDCAPLKRWELPPYVVKLAQKRGLSMDNAAAQELVERVGESTVALDNQIATLAQLVGDAGRITLADVEANVAQIAEVSPWAFADAVCERNAPRAMEMLNLMKAPSLVFLHSVLVARLRELICAKSLDARGAASGLARELGRQSWQVKNHVRWSRAFGEEELVELLGQAAVCERALKGSQDSEAAFARFVLAMASPNAAR